MNSNTSVLEDLMVWLIDLKETLLMKTNKKLLQLFLWWSFPHALGGLMIWSQLPNQIWIHFNFAGQANNFQPTPGCVWSSYFSISWWICLWSLWSVAILRIAMNEKNDQSDLLVGPIASLKYSYLIYSKALRIYHQSTVLFRCCWVLSLWSWEITCPKLKVNPRLGSVCLGPSEWR